MSQDLFDQALQILERRAEEEKARREKTAEDATARAKARDEQVHQLADFIGSPDYKRFGNLLRLTGENVVITDERNSDDETLKSVILVWPGFRKTYLDEDEDNVFKNLPSSFREREEEVTLGDVVYEWTQASVVPVPNLVEHIKAEMAKIAQEVIDSDSKTSPAQRSRKTKYHCSFCSKNQDQVRRLIAGPGPIYICNECVQLCQEIVDDESPEPSRILRIH